MARRTRTIAALGATAAMTLLLVGGCSLSHGDDPVPAPTRTAALGPDDAATQLPEPTPTPTPVLAPGTVAAETDVVSRSGETSVHVRVVQRADAQFDVELSDYRTSDPQPMSVEFRHRTAHWGDGNGGTVRGWVQWDAAEPPKSYTLDAGTRPDYLASVVLVPVAETDPPEGFATERPWIGSVMAVGALDWRLPEAFPDLRVTPGDARPGAYGSVRTIDGTPTAYAVSSGDEPATVAERFGITVEELAWLNPFLVIDGQDGLLDDTTLNLDPAAR